ncbi:MAG TPA: AAA family ATPase, partial [Methanoregulaceae archaeon]|nr:AAA family ATPase [Methanoregulaceae archaeon]
MHITELEIDNFKSFLKKTKIPFFEGFTVISGPNGSGKSNIIDSILFVLALSSSRTLRAEKLTDLINLNSAKPIAEVSLSFSDGTKIRRRIKKTGSGYYSYNYLNEKLCKQSEVTEFLSKFGIKPHGYNVVMQGDITRIIEMSDFERRKIIDEIAGVSEFDAKKDQAIRELEV